MSRPHNAPEPATFNLLLLGRAVLTNAGGDLVAGMGPGKPLAMLAYLTLNESAQREELVSLLWPEMPEDRARNAFRQTLHRLRGAIGHDVLTAEREVIAITVGDALWCDAVEFQETAQTDVERALTLYRGPFLGGLNVGSAPFEQWAEAQRERMEAQYRGALVRATNTSFEAGDTERAAERARTLSRVAPLDPQAAILEAKTLVAAGRKPEAVSVLTQHGARIETELGAKPAGAVTAMLQRLVSEVPSAAATPTDMPDLLPEAEFVGRDGELGRMLGLWRRIEEHGAFAIVTGAPGIGKTRLLRELTQRISAFGPALVLWGQERHGNRAIPYAAIADALRPAVTAPGVAGASQHLLAEAARLLPEIRDQFNLPEARPLEDDAARIRFFEGVAALLDAVAFEQPVCVVIEDLQHASRSSAELLQFLTQRLAAAPILFLTSYRQADSPTYVLDRFEESQLSAAQDAAESESHPVRVQIPLGGLDAAAAHKLVGSVVTQNELSAEAIASVTAAAEGNPFRALDLVRRVRRGEPVAKLPAEISGILWARLQSCSPHEQRLFLASALLGRPAPLRLLAAATHLAEPIAFDAALALEQRGLTVQRNGGVAPAHDVLAHLALEGTGSAGRALLAGWTADALASDPGASNAELAQLYAAAGQPSSAHRYARVAVLDAAGSGADEELENLLTLASQTALNNEDRRAVESLRTTLRGGARRLSGGAGDFARPGSGASRRPATELPPTLGAGAPPDANAADHVSTPPASVRGRSHRWLSSRSARIGAVVLIAVAASAALLSGRGAAAGARGTVLADSVLVAERVGARGSRRYFVTGPILPSATMRDASAEAQPEWIGELSLPWANPQVSPDGGHVAVERITAGGTDLYVISASQRDTIPLAVGGGDDLFAGWSPDGRWLLVIHGASDGERYRSELHAYPLAAPAAKIALDTSSARAVIDAVWSPTGMHVAWTARAGPGRQQDVFVGLGDGTGGRNVTNSESEDYRPVWSPDGQRLVFTSDRTGDAELYSLELSTSELRRLTFDPAQDDRASFSSDGDFVAFESTRGGHAGVFIMPPLGGSARRVTPPERNFELLGWRGRQPGYVATLRAAAPASMAVGEEATATATTLDQYGATIAAPVVGWEALDTAVELVPAEPGSNGADAPAARVLAREAGIARVVARVGAWRTDTAFMLVGAPFAVLSDDFTDGLPSHRWSVLGDPQPVVRRGAGVDGSDALILRSDAQWESGILGTTVVPLRPGVSLTARIRAPFSSPGQPGGFTLALVAAEATSAIDVAAPQFLKVASLSWLPDAGRLGYSAEREFWSEPAHFQRGGDWHTFAIEVEADGRVAYYVEGRLRRRSSIVVAEKDRTPRVQLWIAGRGTGDQVLVDGVHLRVGGTN